MKALNIEPRQARTHLMEHRFGRRIRCEARVRLCAAGAIVGDARIRDVSISGAFIETTMNLPLFAPIEVTVKREDGVAETCLLGAVVRKNSSGIAVEWADALAGPLCPLLGCASRCQSARDAGYS